MKQNWNLESIYPTDAAFETDLTQVRTLLAAECGLSERILKVQDAGALLKQLESYVSCLMAENPADSKAHVKNGTISALQADYEAVLFSLGDQLASLSKEAFQDLLKQFQDISFFLEELRIWTKKKGSSSQEELINALSADGYHSFWALYQTITGKMKIGEKQFSVGQAYNLLSDPDRSVRLNAFKQWNEAWKDQSDVLAQILNHLAGFRLRVYEARGWDEVLFEPLFMNRMEPATLDAMWAAVDEAKPAFLRYLEKKAELLGLEKLSWMDVEVPLSKVKEVPYGEAAQSIIEQFERFHPRKAAFAKKALENRWVEAEDRVGKAAGGFCVSLPKTKESRIFMTYKGTPLNVATLAHELGHAYHNLCIEHLPYFAQQIQMNVAETASTFGEMVVLDQAIAMAQTPEEKRQLLDDKLQRSVAYFMNLQARLIFEKAFYAERKKGFVSTEKLCELMVAAQKQAYCDSLSDWDPYFWASKLHFYFTHFAFYNFPYTFGYLMSNGLYQHAKKGNFGEKLDGFLEDTAQMRVEDLAKKHLGVDLTKPDFWRFSVDALVQDVETFVNLPTP